MGFWKITGFCGRYKRVLGLVGFDIGRGLGWIFIGCFFYKGYEIRVRGLRVVLEGDWVGFESVERWVTW